MEEVLARVTTLAESGRFGQRRFLGASVNPDAKPAPNFASQLGFFVVEFKNGEEISKHPIVTKIQPKTDLEKMIQNSDNQFYCEVTMYTEILPKLKAYELGVFPEFWYGEATMGEPERDIIIMGDLRTEGYTTASELFLAPEAMRFVLRKLGEFHGLTYRTKKNNEDILSVAKSLPYKKFSENFDGMNFPCIERGFKAVQAKKPSPVLDEALEKIRHLRPSTIWTRMRLPKEPFATIVHGDFNVNNLMFKFDGNGQVEGVKFVDFQVSTYSDPAVDIAFILYMNTSQQGRNENWDSFLRAYWEGLVSVCPLPGFTHEEFLEDFAAHALYGYLPCSFFLPMMIETTRVPLEEFAKWDLEKQIQRMTKNGGQKGTDALSDIVNDLLDRGYLDSFLKNF